jgi:Holliday junction resolvasome RuvABC endonuclease subunit
MICLGLDLGLAVGWAVFKGAEAKRPQLGTFDLPEAPVDRPGRRYLALDEWVDNMILVCTPQLVAFEAPIVPIDKRAWHLDTDAATVRFLIGLASIVELVAYRRNVRCIEVAVPTVKNRMTGNQWAKKRQVVAAAVKAGYRIADAHQADACGVALAAFDHVGAGPRVESGQRDLF